MINEHTPFLEKMYNYNIINDRDQYMDYVQDNCVLVNSNENIRFMFFFNNYN